MARLRWLLWLGLGALGVGLAAGFGWLLWRGPAWVYRDAWPQLTAAEQVTATGQFRIALIQVAAAVGAVVALAYTASTYRLANRGQLTERFSKALERLGSEEPYVRLGGVHALAHVLRESADHHLDVVEVLVAFVRQRTPRAAHRTGVASQGADTSGVPVPSDRALPAEPAPDVQAALTALGRRPRRPEPRGMLYLRDLHLASALLGGADLTGALLGGTDLTRARLEGANLAGAQLREFDLPGAGLTRSGAVGLTQAQLDVAWGDAATRLPTELQRPASWTAAQEAVADAAPADDTAGDPPAPPAEHPG
jgi:Pentapeptide repeats (8 copies)